MTQSDGGQLSGEYQLQWLLTQCYTMEVKQGQKKISPNSKPQDL